MFESVKYLTYINLSIIISRSQHAARGKSQMQALSDISVRIKRCPRILYCTKARLVAFASTRFTNSVEEWHGAVFRQTLNVSRESWLRRVSGDYRLVKLVLGLLRVLRVFGFIDTFPALGLVGNIL